MPALQSDSTHLETLSSEVSFKEIWKLAWPIMVLEALAAVNQLLDSLFVGSLETSALTALGASYMIVFLIVGFSMSAGISAIALASRFYGQNDTVKYQKASRQVNTISFVTGLVLATIGLLTREKLAIYLLPDHNLEAIAQMKTYLTYCYLGLPAALAAKAIAGALVGTGDSKSPMIISGSLIIVHAILNCVLIPQQSFQFFSFKLPSLGLGIQGAGMASFLTFSIMLIAYLIYSSKTAIGSCLKFEKPEIKWVNMFYKQSVPSAFTWIIRIMSIAGLLKLVSDMDHGSEIIAGTRVGFSIESLIFVSTIGFAAAASTITGQSLGMNNPERAKKSVWKTAHLASGILLIMSIFMFIYAERLSYLLVPNKELVIKESTLFLKYLAVTEVLTGYGLVLTAAMQGAGDAARSMRTQIIYFILPRIPIALLCIQLFSNQPIWCWFAIAVSQATLGIAAIYVFRQEKWKLAKL